MFPARIKNVIIGIISVFIITLFISKPALAATDFNTQSDVPNNSHYRAQVVLIDITSALICQLIGIDVVNPAQSCLGIDGSTGKIGFAPTDTTQPRVGGAIGTLTNMISMTFKIPVQTKEYTSYVASNFNLIKPAHAQTTGFDNLSALLSLWRKVRDLTYFGFVVIFVVLGFSIMLRVKLDPRTVMTIQNQIPKIVISIILITFSYAIAGLLIDLMWVSTYTGINILTDATPACEDGSTLAQVGTNSLYMTPFHYVSRILQCHIGGGMTELSYNVGQALGDIVTTMFFSVLGMDPGTNPSCDIFNIDQCLNRFVSFIVGLLAFLAVIIAILIQLARVWLSLIKSYIFIILYTLLGPIWIFAGLMPGNTNFGFTQWLRRMLFALSIYPATVLLLLVASVLISDENLRNPVISNGQDFVPPLISNPSISNNVGYIIALGVILLAPQVIEMMREAFKAPPSKYGADVFKSLGTGASVGTTPVRKGWGSLNKYDSQGNPVGPLAFAQRRVGNRVWKGIQNKVGDKGPIGKAVNKYVEHRENMQSRYNTPKVATGTNNNNTEGGATQANAGANAGATARAAATTPITETEEPQAEAPSPVYGPPAPGETGGGEANEGTQGASAEEVPAEDDSDSKTT